MDLPHQEPIRFAQELLESTDRSNIVSCKFPFLPTLAMVCEAAAQSSASFSLNEKTKEGFLVSMKNIELLNELTELVYKIEIEKSFTFGAMSEFNFQLIKDSMIFVKGTLTIALPDNS